MSPGALLDPRNARILFGVALAASGGLLVAWHSDITFLIDDWNLLLHRRGFNADAIFEPHAQHLIAGPAAVYKTIQATLGMDSSLPYGVAAIASFLASAVLLFVYLRRRVGDWVALAALLPVLVMGTAYEDLLSAFQIGYFGSVAFGIAALLAIERADARGDVMAGVLLVASLAFAEIAFAFAAGVLVALALQRGPLRRAWVVVVPVLIYSLWYAVFGSDDASSLSARDVATSPAYVLSGFASSLASLLGIGTPAFFGGTGGLEWGRSLLVGATALAIGWMIRMRSAPRWWVLVALAVALGFWLMVAANADPLRRPPYASRYQFPGAVFILMIAAELASGWRPGWRGVLGALAVGVLAALGNLATLSDGHRALSAASASVRGGLAGLEIAADRVDPDLVLTGENSNFDYFSLVRAEPYLSAATEYGSPAYSGAELPGAPEGARRAADKVLAAALPVRLGPRTAASREGGCTTVSRAGPDGPIVDVPAGGASLRAPRAASVELRRFATGSFPVELGSVRGAAELIVPADRSDEPWQLRLESEGPVAVCPV